MTNLIKGIGLTFIFVLLLVFSFGDTSEASGLSKEQWNRADRIAQFCEDHWEEYGCLPSVAVAQAFIESTLGEHCQDFNYWGIRSGAEHYASLEEGVRRYCEVINNGCYGTAPGTKDYSSQIRKILDGGYCTPEGEYYSNVVWSIEHYDFAKYDRDMFAKIKAKKKALKEAKRKAQWDKTWTIQYDPTVPAYKAAVPKSIIRKGCVVGYVGDTMAFFYDVIPSKEIKGRVIHVNIPGLDGKKCLIDVIEEAKG